MNAFILFGGMETSSSLEYCLDLRRRGIYALIVDSTVNRKGQPNFFNREIPEDCVADFFLIDPADIIALIQKVTEWQGSHQIVGGLNTTEEFLLPAAYVLDYLGLPGPGVFASLVSSRKDLQRQYLRELGPRCFSARASVGSAISIPMDAPYPLVIKPIEAHGGAGLEVVHTRQEALRALAQRAGSEVVIEEYIEGTDLSVESLVQDGIVIFENVTEEVSLPPPLSHLEMGHSTPPTSLSAAEVEEALTLNRMILQRIRFRSGMTHNEFRRDKNGRIRFIEIAARPPGDSLPRLYSLSTGRPIEEQVLNCVLGEPVAYPAPKRWARQTFFVHEKPGLFGGVDGLPPDIAPNSYFERQSRRLCTLSEDSAPPRLHEVFLYYRPGERLPALSDASTRLGFYLLSAPDKSSLLEADLAWKRALVPRIDGPTA